MLAQKNRLGRSWAVLEASWGILEASWSLLEVSWGILGLSRGVLRRFEASSRLPGWGGPTGYLQRAGFWGGPNRVLSEASSLNPRPLKGILSKGSSLYPGHTVGASPVADYL